jgi:hypothetical protein
MSLDSLEREYAMGDLKLYREFDSSHFISNAKSAITNKVEAVNLRMKMNYYSSMLTKALNDFSAINLDKDEFNDFIGKFESMDRLPEMNLTIRDLNQEDIGAIKPQYISQYVLMIQMMIDKVLNNAISDAELMRFISNEFPIKVEKQVVKTDIGYGLTSKEMLKNEVPIVKVDSNYVLNTVIPFVSNYQSVKTQTITEAKGLLDAIIKAEDDIKAMLAVIEKIKSEGKYPFETITKLNQVSFNAIRGIIDIMSYCTFIMIRKMNNINGKAIACERLFNDLTNVYSIEMASEAAGISNNIIATDAYSVADQFLDGRADTFVELSRNAIDYYSSLTNFDNIENFSEYSLANYENYNNGRETGQYPYNIEVYSDIAKGLLSISSGLDIIGKEGDEYLLIFDDILKDAGLNMPLRERFRNELENIKDITHSEQNVMFNEIMYFGRNMESLAAIVFEVHNKIELLIERFDRNTNQEYNDVATITELKSFLENFLGEFIDFVKDFSELYMKRLVELKRRMDEIVHTPSEAGSIVNVEYNDDTDNTDYLGESEMSIIDEFEENTAEYFKELETSYFKEREYALKGMNVVIEADTQPTVQTSDANNQKPSTQVTVQDNSGTDNKDAKSGGTLSKLKADILNWIQEKINKFRENLEKAKPKNTKWLADNKEELLGRSYNNVTVNILPYQNIAADAIIGDIGKVSGAVKGMTPQNLQSITKKGALYKKLFPSINGIAKTKNLGESLVTYYKVGTGKMEVQPISNGELKTQITTVIFPFCEAYQNDYSNRLTAALEELGKAVDNQIKSYGGGTAVTESVSIFTEEENKNTEGNISEKANWMREAVKIYAGSVMNAVRDRNNDYLKVLSSLTPKTPVKPANENK